MTGFWEDGSHDAVAPPCTWCAALFHSARHHPVFLHSLQSNAAAAAPRQLHKAPIPGARLMSDLQHQPFTTRRLLNPFSVLPAAFSPTPSSWVPRCDRQKKPRWRTETSPSYAGLLLQTILKCSRRNTKVHHDSSTSRDSRGVNQHTREMLLTLFRAAKTGISVWYLLRKHCRIYTKYLTTQTQGQKNFEKDGDIVSVPLVDRL